MSKSSNQDSIDILQLYSTKDHKKWNLFLDECVANLDINRLAMTMRRLQVGMAELSNKKMNTDDIDVQYLRWIKSIENTARLIIRKINPLPQDDPMIAKKKEFVDQLEVKRARDRALADFIKRSSY